jgi:hypothetical protein
MTTNEVDQNHLDEPRYTIGEIMALLAYDERAVRELLVAAGADVDPSKIDPHEKIAYADYCRLWVSRVNRSEGKLLATLLVEESTSWFDRLFGS